VPLMFAERCKSMVERFPVFSASLVARALLVFGLVVQLVIVSTSPSAANSDVDDSLLELGSETLQKFVASRGTTVVEFYQPWYAMPLIAPAVHFATATISCSPYPCPGAAHRSAFNPRSSVLQQHSRHKLISPASTCTRILRWLSITNCAHTLFSACSRSEATTHFGSLRRFPAIRCLI